MNLQSQAVNAALALFPVYPPQWVTPVQPPSIAHGGIPLAAFTPQGLEVIIEPITGLRNWAVAAFDVVTLYVNNVRTNVSKTIMPGEEGNRFLLYLPELWFSNGVNDVFYRVTRVSGNNDDSPTLQLLYHNPAPTITVSHPPSIGPGQPAVITLTVGYARPYDTVTLTIGTWSITFTNPDPTKPITHTLTAAELQQIGNGTHSVSARVVDQLTNNNVSPTTSITISANQSVTITSYTDSANTSVSNGGWTYETGGTLTGTAGSNQQVQILLNGTVRQTVTANAAGIWTYSISGLAVFAHIFIARPLPAGADSAQWLLHVRSEWQDHYTSLADSYNGWIPYAGARSGSIRPFLMANQWVTAFFNFTDQGAPTGFAGAIFYHDFLFIPGQYHFTFEGTHVADSPNPQLVNPILCADTGMVQWPGDRREVPKNGVWYLFLNAFTITQRQVARLYVSNFQDGSNGNDFGIRNIRVVRLDSGGGVMSTPVVGPEAPIYTRPLPDLVYP